MPLSENFIQPLPNYNMHLSGKFIKDRVKITTTLQLDKFLLYTLMVCANPSYLILSMISVEALRRLP